MIVTVADERGPVVPAHAAVIRVVDDQPGPARGHDTGEVGERREHRLAVGEYGNLRISAVRERELVSRPGRTAVARRERGAAGARVHLWHGLGKRGAEYRSQQARRIGRVNGQMWFREPARVGLSGNFSGRPDADALCAG